MRTLFYTLLLMVTASSLCFSSQISEQQRLEHFLSSNQNAGKSSIQMIYTSILQIDKYIKGDPSYDSSIIGTWRTKVESITSDPAMKPFLKAASLDSYEIQDYDMLARSIWFPKDFLFTDSDKKLLSLLIAATKN